MTEHSTAHPPGLFGHIGGVEVALLSITQAGTLGAPVDYVTARRADVPAGTPEVSVDRADSADLIRVPVSVVDQLARWWWTVRLDGGEYQASQMRDGQVLIGTSDSRFVWGDGWDGNVRDGWQRWVDAEGLDATATRHPFQAAAWKAMNAAELCDTMEFWASASWPLTRDEAQKLAIDRFGWTIEVENGTSYLMNTVSGFTITDVTMIDLKDVMMDLSLDVSDTIRDVTPESTAFLGDAFALMVREGESRWGTPTMTEFEDTVAAHWDVAGGARIEFTFLPKGLTAMYETPQGAELSRESGNR